MARNGINKTKIIRPYSSMNYEWCRNKQKVLFTANSCYIIPVRKWRRAGPDIKSSINAPPLATQPYIDHKYNNLILACIILSESHARHAGPWAYKHRGKWVSLCYSLIPQGNPNSWYAAKVPNTILQLTGVNLG